MEQKRTCYIPHYLINWVWHPGPKIEHKRRKNKKEVRDTKKMVITTADNSPWTNGDLGAGRRWQGGEMDAGHGSRSKHVLRGAEKSVRG